MILSNTEIQKALDERRLVIDPEPQPRSATEGSECPYNTTSVDLSLGHEILVPKSRRPFNIDLREGRFASLTSDENYEQKRLEDDLPYSLKPNCFVLARTLEKVAFPLPKDPKVTALSARVEGRSSLARCGMLVHFTAPTIHAGFSGHIALEIINLGPTIIALYPKARICQLIVEEVRGVPFRNESQFQGQTGAGGKARARGKRGKPTSRA